ncbi:Transcriptional activator protein UGA3 [Colletotrichum spinosum]|uniref:Transcriptional activator protein UGA3 n=1 Tax=Colletotrichum spinosum TaxID=1347390 RepID=A0A4R8QHZ9_9PEZI|nr:Transcriptional activator protein UGA3 [Colletotrichum spinosum]
MGPLDVHGALAFSHSASSEFLVDGKPDLVHSRRMMLRYYTAHLVFMLTNNLQNNCFLSVLLPMAFECPALMYALAASSSAHLALQHDSFRLTALEHRGAAITELKASMSGGTMAREMRLAVTLVLCSMESISCGTDNWTHHLSGAAACLQESKGVTSTPQDPKVLLARSYEGRWLLRNFAYHDIIMSVSLDQRPQIAGDYWCSEEELVADPYFGLAARVIFLIGEISHLNADFGASAAAGARGQVSSGTMIPLSRRSRHLEAQLREWKCQTYNRDESLVLLAEAYRHGALIHLYRTLRRHVPTHREAICRKISESVAAVCGISKTMARGCYAETSMIFPLFIAGGEADIAEEVDIIREALCSLNTSRRFRNVEACVDVLDELWQRSGSGADGDDESKAHIDWLDVAKRRGWKMALF